MISALLCTVGAATAAGIVLKRVANRADTFAPKVLDLRTRGILDEVAMQELQQELAQLRPWQVRRANPLRKGGAVARTHVEANAPRMTALYRNPAVRALAEEVFELPAGSLQLVPADNQQSLCLYLYDQPGDFIGWHFDKPAYNSDRFAMLLCLESTSGSHFETRFGSFAATPGEAVFFIGERMLHRVTPTGPHGSRVVLQLEYVTDNRPTASWRTLMRKGTDRAFYFGFRETKSSHETRS